MLAGDNLELRWGTPRCRPARNGGRQRAASGGKQGL